MSRLNLQDLLRGGEQDCTHSAAPLTVYLARFVFTSKHFSPGIESRPQVFAGGKDINPRKEKMIKVGAPPYRYGGATPTSTAP